MSDQSISTKEAIHLEHEHSAHNYHPLPVVLAKGEGVHVWDPEGKKYANLTLTVMLFIAFFMGLMF